MRERECASTCGGEERKKDRKKDRRKEGKTGAKKAREDEAACEERLFLFAA